MKAVDLYIELIHKDKQQVRFAIRFTGVMSRRMLYLKQNSVMDPNQKKTIYIKVMTRDTTANDVGNRFMEIEDVPEETAKTLICKDSRVKVILTNSYLITMIEQRLMEMKV